MHTLELPLQGHPQQVLRGQVELQQHTRTAVGSCTVLGAWKRKRGSAEGARAHTGAWCCWKGKPLTLTCSRATKRSPQKTLLLLS